MSLCRSLRIPDLREGDDSPLRTSPRLAQRAIFPSRRLSTQRICRCVRNVTCRTQSQPCVSASRELWRMHCRDVLVADKSVRRSSCRMSDAVGLGSRVLFRGAHSWPHRVQRYPWSRTLGMTLAYITKREIVQLIYQRGHRHQDNDFGRKAGHPRTCSFCRVGQPIASALLTNPSHGHPFKAASHPEFPEPPRP